MTQTKVFDEEALSFGANPYTRGSLIQLFSQNANWTMGAGYVRSCLKDRVSRGLISETNSGVYQNSAQYIASRGLPGRANTSAIRPRVPDPDYRSNPISDQNALSFFCWLIESVYSEGHGLRLQDQEIDQHFSSSERNLLDPFHALSDIQFIFKELAFHAQNSPLGDVIQFDPNNPNSAAAHIEAITNGFDPTQPLGTYQQFASFASYADPKNAPKLRSYYHLLEESACLLNGLTSVTDFENRIGSNGSGATAKDIFQSFSANIRSLYKEALTFDFLKEFGIAFGLTGYDFPKPDRHFKRTIVWLYDPPGTMAPFLANHRGFDVNAVDSFATMDCCTDHLIPAIKREYASRSGAYVNKITNYLLDKAIYILASGYYYLRFRTKKKSIGNRFYRGLASGAYRSFPINIASIDGILGRL